MSAADFAHSPRSSRPASLDVARVEVVPPARASAAAATTSVFDRAPAKETTVDDACDGTATANSARASTAHDARDDDRAPSAPSASMPSSSVGPFSGIHRRIDSIGNALSDSRAATTKRLSELKTMTDAWHATHGVHGTKMWIVENRKIIFKMMYFIAFFCALTLTVLVLFAHVWVALVKAISLRLAYAVAFALVLAMAPPAFPNAAAHVLALVLMSAEIALLCLNAVLLGLVHVAIALNKYVLPAWFQRARVIVRESAGGVDHRGRANAHYTDERQSILVELEHATTYAEWRAVASKLDSFPADVGEGGVAWRADDHSEAYDSRLVGVYLNAMSSARERNDLTALGLCLRTVLHRNFGGIDRLLGLRFARVGTKKLVEAFRDEIVATIEHIAATNDNEHAIEMLQVLKESYRSLGRTALCLSGGGALAMYHFGVLKVLLSEGLCPQVISGTSGGSIVAAYLGCVPPNELLETITPDIPTRYSRRWFPRPHKMALHFLQHGVLMDSEGFSQTTKAYFGDTTFEEAFQLSGRALSIQVSIGSQTGYVLNHLTSPAVLLRTAVCASCALPGLMRPVEILAKDKSGNLVPFHPPDVKSYDGTITQDIPSARLTELFNCNNFIVSQVNPHLNFVLHLAEESHGRRQKTARSYQRRNAVQKLLRVANFLLLNIKYGIQKLLEVDLFDIRFVRTLQGVLMQDFRGHITILPSLKWRDYSKIGAQPSERDMQRFITRGEQATWPHVEVIRYTMQIETVLVNAIRALSKRVDAMGAGTVKRTSSHGFLEH